MESATALVKLASLIRECGQALSSLTKVGDVHTEGKSLAEHLDAIAERVDSMAQPKHARQNVH